MVTCGLNFLSGLKPSCDSLERIISASFSSSLMPSFVPIQITRGKFGLGKTPILTKLIENAENSIPLYVSENLLIISSETSPKNCTVKCML